MALRKYVMGLFREEERAVSAIEALENTQWKLQGVHGPFPSHRILDALKPKKSRVGYFTLAGGIIGFFAGLGLAVFTASQWHIIVSGKPVIALAPFFIVGFEFSILFAVFGNILGLLTQARLPGFKGLKTYDPRCSGEHFGVLASCNEGEEGGLMVLFQKRGGEVKVFDS
ncbi:MAG: DUF3341 domain-containing protein [Pseudomonadota bacterium]